MFTILHTNDFHNRLIPAQASRLQELRRRLGANGLLFDAGDAIAAGNMTFRPGGEPILAEMTSIRYDAMTVGNREFHFSRFGFFCKLGQAGFPILCANVRCTNVDCGNLPVKSHVCFTLGSSAAFRALVFGVTVPMITERMTSRHVSSYVFDDPVVVGATLAARLKAEFQPDLLIGLTHIGIERDRDLAVAAPEIDLIVGGHTHNAIEHGEWVGETLIVQAGSHGRYYGRVHIEPNPIAGGRPGMRAQLEPLC